MIDLKALTGLKGSQLPPPSMKAHHLLSLCLALAPQLQAQDSKPKVATYLTVEDARKDGSDIDLQGEYSDPKLGAQVIALGNDTFRAVLHNGGLPGWGWDKSEKVEIEAKRVGEAVEFSAEGFKATLKNNSLSGENSKGKFNLQRVNRQSPTLGAKPPAGAVAPSGAARAAGRAVAAARAGRLGGAPTRADGGPRGRRGAPPTRGFGWRASASLRRR